MFRAPSLGICTTFVVVSVPSRLSFNSLTSVESCRMLCEGTELMWMGHWVLILLLRRFLFLLQNLIHLEGADTDTSQPNNMAHLSSIGVYVAWNFLENCISTKCCTFRFVKWIFVWLSQKIGSVHHASDGVMNLRLKWYSIHTQWTIMESLRKKLVQEVKIVSA